MAPWDCVGVRMAVKIMAQALGVMSCCTEWRKSWISCRAVQNGARHAVSCHATWHSMSCRAVQNGASLGFYVMLYRMAQVLGVMSCYTDWRKSWVSCRAIQTGASLGCHVVLYRLAQVLGVMSCYADWRKSWVSCRAMQNVCDVFNAR